MLLSQRIEKIVSKVDLILEKFFSNGVSRSSFNFGYSSPTFSVDPIAGTSTQPKQEQPTIEELFTQPPSLNTIHPSPTASLKEHPIEGNPPSPKEPCETHKPSESTPQSSVPEK